MSRREEGRENRERKTGEKDRRKRQAKKTGEEDRTTWRSVRAAGWN
jgi:hypothetical protein